MNSEFCCQINTNETLGDVGVDVNVDDGNTFAKGDVSLQQTHLSAWLFVLVMVVAPAATAGTFFNKVAGAVDVFSTTFGDSSNADAAADTVVVEGGEWHCFPMIIFPRVIFPGSSFAAWDAVWGATWVAALGAASGAALGATSGDSSTVVAEACPQFFVSFCVYAI